MTTALTSFLGDTFTAFATAWSEALLNSIWQGALLVLLVWLVLRTFRSVNAATRQMIWLATLVALAALPLVSGRFAERYGGPRVDPPATATETVPALRLESAERTSTVTPLPEQHAPEPAQSKPLAMKESSGVRDLAERAPFGGNAQLSGFPSATAPIRLRSGAWGALLMLTWLCIVAAHVYRLLRSILAIRRIKRESVSLPTPLVQKLAQWQQHLGVRRPVKLAWSGELGVPVVLGWRRPLIVFPLCLADQLTDDEAEQVILHELAHVARRDDWWQIMQRVIESIFFFSPAVHIAARQAALEREVACDDWVVETRRNPKAYARCLSRLVEQAQAPLWPVPGAVLPRKHIFRRVEMLLDRNRNVRPRASRMGTAVAIALLGLFMVQAGFMSPVVAVSAEPTEPTAPQAPPAPPAPEVAGIESGQRPAPVPSAAPAPPAPRGVASTPGVPSVPSVPGVPTPPSPEANESYREARAYYNRALAQSGIEQSEEALREAEARLKEADERLKDLGDMNYDGTMSIHHDDGERTWMWSNKGQKVRVEMDGDVTFSADGSAIKNISKDGYFIIEERHRGRSVELEVVPNRQGELEYFFFRNREPAEYDDDARAWFGTLLPVMMRESGIGARERVQGIRAERGVDGVLREISVITSDYVKRIYFEELVKSGPLNASEVRTMFRQVGHEIDSDYEKAELLIKYARYTDGDPETRDAFVEAVAGIDSDYETRRVLSAMGTKKNLDRSYAEAVLDIAMRMDSDYEKAELLLELSDFSRDNTTARNRYLEAVSRIDSDYEKRRVLERLLMPSDVDDEFVARVLAIAETIDSDYERVELLQQLGEHAVYDDELLREYLAAVATIGSDYEARRALSALPWHDGISEEARIDLLRMVARMGSDFEKAEFLIEYAEYFVDSEAVQDAYERAADSIGSDYERDRVFAKLYRPSRSKESSRKTY